MIIIGHKTFSYTRNTQVTQKLYKNGSMRSAMVDYYFRSAYIKITTKILKGKIFVGKKVAFL